MVFIIGGAIMQSIELRTEKLKLLMCNIEKDCDNKIYFVYKNGKREDKISWEKVEKEVQSLK